MASSQQPILASRWSQRSVVHETKLRMLQSTAEDQLRRIDAHVTCTQEAFKLGGPTSDGTCVYVGLRVTDGKEVAVKCLSDNCEHLAENESKILRMLKMEKSPHVLQYLYYQREKPFVYIISELCEFSLEEYVQKARDLPDQIPFDPQKIIKEILTGLDVLHNKQGFKGDDRILHRDLKPDNVLVDVEWSIRLADFGLSKTIDEGSSSNYTSGKGDAQWQAAESIPSNGEKQKVLYKRRSDIQVAGMLSFYVLTKGRHPFGEVSHERPKNIIDGRPVSLDILTDPVEKDFVSWLIQKDISNRPLADEALKHPFLKSIEDQFNLLVVMGNEREVIKEDQRCDVVRALNNHSNDYGDGWMEKIPSEIVQNFSRNRGPYNNNITSLLRFLRNVKEHINNSPQRFQLLIGEPATYFLHRERFSTLPMLVHKILREQAKDVARRGSNEVAWINRSALKSLV